MTPSRWLPVVALPMCLACPAPRSLSQPLSTTERTAIGDSVRVMLGNWRNALNAMDPGRSATFYSPDAAFRWYEDGELRYRSGVELIDTLRTALRGFRNFELTLVEPEITALAPGVAVLTTNFTQRMTDTAGHVYGLIGAISATVRDGPAGWQFLVGHTSSPAPPVAAPKATERLKTGDRLKPRVGHKRP